MFLITKVFGQLCTERRLDGDGRDRQKKPDNNAAVHRRRAAACLRRRARLPEVAIPTRVQLSSALLEIRVPAPRAAG